MKPFYSQSGITIYHGDCREVLPTLPPESVDLIITDPPYGMRWQSGSRRLQFDPIIGDDSGDAAVEGLRAALPALRGRRHVYVFGRFDFSSLALQEPTELIWDKSLQSSGDLESPWGQEHEYIQFAVYQPSEAHKASGKGRLMARLRKGSVLRVPRLIGLSLRHPAEKPVLLLRELIESSSCIGETVLDSFMGVGSTLVAARIEGREAIGIELDERYCEIAARRLAQDVLPLEVA